MRPICAQLMLQSCISARTGLFYLP